MIKKELMPAKTAREIVNNKICEDVIIKVWNKIVGEIEDAIADGCHSLLYNNILPIYITQQLMSLGYTVENNFKDNTCYIRWGSSEGCSRILCDETNFSKIFGGGHV